MKNKISFKNFTITPQKLECTYFQELNNSPLNTGQLFFEFSIPIQLSEQTIAIALSTLCKTNYSSIYFDLNLPPKLLIEISSYTHSEVTAKELSAEYYQHPTTSTLFLNFSGGLDSLAAYYLVPKDTILISLNFGVEYEREYSFYKKFNPLIVKTNLLETKLDKNSWSFMGIGSLFLSEQFNAKYISFGTIIEAAPSGISKNTPYTNNETFPSFRLAQLENAPYVGGLTEMGTLLIVAQNNPTLINQSLISLAPPTSSKRYRKQLLASIVEKNLNLDLKLDLVSPPRKPFFNFGEHFVEDFLSIYMIKHLGVENISSLITNIPDDIIELATSLSLTFYERIHPDYIEHFPLELRPEFLSNLAKSNIVPYSITDFEEFTLIKKALSQYHPSIK